MKFSYIAALGAIVSISFALTKEEATAEGVKYFAGRCKDQQKLLKDLESALETGDLAQSKQAYVNSRPPYEEIEVLATADDIGPLDSAIDARPYGFDGGEDNEEFQGFHLIERDLYREGNVSKAAESVKGLIESVDELCVVLDDGSTITPQNSLDGQMALAYELAAKKISSEEEAWSDAHLVIYKHNIVGIYSQYKPFEEVEGVTETIKARVNAAYDVVVKKFDAVDTRGFFAQGADRMYSSLSIKERKDIMEAAYDFAAAIREVHTALSEEGGEEEEEEESGDPIIADGAFMNETAQAVANLRMQCTNQQESLKPLKAAIMDGEMPEARQVYARARLAYEQIEVVAGAYEEEDTTIDARPDGYEFGERTETWTGMHKVEQAIYRDNDQKSAMEAIEDVEAAVESLCKKLDNPEVFSANDAFDGAIGLATEVPAKKISSEEETWSDLSVMIFRENTKGINAVYSPFRGLLGNETRDAVDGAIASIKMYWENTIDSKNDWEKGVNFRKYSTVPNTERKGIHDRFMTLKRALEAAQSELGELSTSSSSDPACFPETATVKLEDGSVKRMNELELGDAVLSSSGGYSQVFMWTHRITEGVFPFIRLMTSSGKFIELSEGHFLSVNGKYAAAGSVKIGDELHTSENSCEKVIQKTIVHRRGLFNPQTASGTIVVNDIIASTYTSAINEKIAHTMLALFRAVFKKLAYTYHGFDNGAGAFSKSFLN